MTFFVSLGMIAIAGISANSVY